MFGSAAGDEVEVLDVDETDAEANVTEATDEDEVVEEDEEELMDVEIGTETEAGFTVATTTLLMATGNFLSQIS